MQKLAVNYLRVRFKLLSARSTERAAAKALDFFRTPHERLIKTPSKVFDKAEKLQFALDGLVIHGYRWNQNSGRKVLIVHGFESSIVNFDHYVGPLVGKGYEVLAFDAPAHGLSDGRTITAPLFASMIETIHKDYGPVRSFIAHSFGGLAVSLALENIKHDGSYRVALIAPATETKTAVDQFFDLLKLNGKVRTEFDRLVTQIGGHPAEWYSIHRAVKNIKAEILWLHDEDDLQTPLNDALRVKNENWPNITFIISKGLGHRKIYRDPQTVKTIVDFV